MNLTGFEKLIRRILAFPYRHIFKEDMSEGAYFFAKNLFYIVLGYGVAAFCVFAFQVISGRVFGPEEYGKYALVDAVTMFLHILMIWGFSTAAIKYCAGTRDKQEQKDIISSSFWLVLLFSCVFTIIFLVFYRQLASIFSVPPEIFIFSIVFADFFTVYTVSTNILKGINQMKKLAVFRMVYGVAILACLFLFMLAGRESFRSIVLSISFAYAIVSLIAIASVRKYINFKINIPWAKKLFRYGNYTILGNVCLAFLPSFNDLVVNKNLSVESVGIYNAYYFSSIGMVFFLMNNFITVFFPMVSAHLKKITILKKINKLPPIILLFGLPLSFALEWIILSLYGSKYPIYFLLIAFFALANVFIIIYQLYNWILYSEGINGAKLANIASMFTVVSNILLAIFLTPVFGLYGATFSLAFSYFTGTIILLLLTKKINLT